MVLLWNQSFTDHWLVVAPIGASIPLPSAETFLGRCNEGVRAAAMMTSRCFFPSSPHSKWSPPCCLAVIALWLAAMGISSPMALARTPPMAPKVNADGPLRKRSTISFWSSP
jgi:hypothetical protein